MKYDKIETGVNLRQLRIENKLSPGEVSDIVDKSESHIMQLERGSRNLTVEMLCKFTDVYNTDPNTILGISSQRMVVMIDKLKSLPTEKNIKTASIWCVVPQLKTTSADTDFPEVTARYNRLSVPEKYWNNKLPYY